MVGLRIVTSSADKTDKLFEVAFVPTHHLAEMMINRGGAVLVFRRVFVGEVRHVHHAAETLCARVLGLLNTVP